MKGRLPLKVRVGIEEGATSTSSQRMESVEVPESWRAVDGNPPWGHLIGESSHMHHVLEI